MPEPSPSPSSTPDINPLPSSTPGTPRPTTPRATLPRPFGLLLLAGAALLVGTYTWFAVVWAVSTVAKLLGGHALDIVLLLLAPHVGGWLLALLLGLVAFILGYRWARRRRVGWLGFPAP